MKWEYKVIKLDAAGFWLSQGQLEEAALEKAINHLGSQGWELVSSYGRNRGGGGTRDVVAIFKRSLG